MSDDQAMSNGSGSPGHDRPLCGGKRRDGGTCRLPAGHGTRHPGIGRCKRHGGSTPTHEASAANALADRAEAAALAELARLNLPPLGDPVAALAQLAAESFAWLDLLRGQVAALASVVGPDHLGDERIRGKVILLERAMDRCERFATSLARLLLDERLAARIVGMRRQIDQAQGEVVARCIERILEALDVRDDPRVPVVVPREFRALASGEGQR